MEPGKNGILSLPYIVQKVDFCFSKIIPNFSLIFVNIFRNLSLRKFDSYLKIKHFLSAYLKPRFGNLLTPKYDSRDILNELH